MAFVDIILLLIIAGFALAGLWFGLVHTIGSLLGTVFGVYLASRFYEPAAQWIGAVTGWEGNMPRIVLFAVAFFVINRLVGVIFWLIDKVLRIVTRLPFIRSLDRFLGFLLGIFEGVITVGIVIFFIERFPVSEGIMQHLSVSVIAPYAAGFASILWPLLPEALRLLQSTVEYVRETVTAG